MAADAGASSQEAFRTPTMAAAWREGVLWLVLTSDGVITAEQAREDVRLLREAAVGRGGRVHVLLDASVAARQDREVRAVYTGPEVTQSIDRLAVVVGSQLSKMIAAIYGTFHPPLFARRVFTSRAEALAWLREV